MDSYLQQFQHLKIPLEEITSATDNFNDEKNFVGAGGFGKVYKGEVSNSMGRSMSAIKRLNPKHGQGKSEFWKEVRTLCRYQHENLVSLRGFCHQGDEMILVYDHASRGSLDRHLNSPHLTWTQRLKICLDVANGLSYLHDPRETHERVIHCDIKSANILLDDHWSAKVSDFGLSTMGPANGLHSPIFIPAVGTPGYCDPQYVTNNILTKEADIYSFGVVLLEVLCGKLCCTNSKGRVQQVLVPTWIESYKQKNLHDIIFKSPTIEPLDQSALETFSDIAYRCLKDSREDRPRIAEVVTELETALIQELSEGKLPHCFYKELTKTSEPPQNYLSKVELKKLLSKGVLLNSGKTWFSLNRKGEHCEMISFAECVDSCPSEYEGRTCSSHYNSRFLVPTYCYENGNVKTRVKTKFLTPLITYTVNLVFKFVPVEEMRRCHRVSLKYKLQGQTKTSISYLADEREDGWWMCELYQFTSEQRTVDLEILFYGFYNVHCTSIEVEGIEFQPWRKHKNYQCKATQPILLTYIFKKTFAEEHEDEKQPTSDLDTNWEEKLPTDYEEIMKWSSHSVHWATKKEAYSIICKGLLISNGKRENIWFSLDKNGKKCHTLSATTIVTRDRQKDTLSYLPDSRFGEAVQLDFWCLQIRNYIRSQLVSSQTRYASYLVYKLPKDQSGFEVPMVVKDEEYLDSDNSWYIYLVSPRTPVIRPKADQNTHNPLNRPKIKGIPKKRSDGWMEVQIWAFQTETTTKTSPIHLKLTTCGAKKFRGLIIEGVEFRPI